MKRWDDYLLLLLVFLVPLLARGAVQTQVPETRSAFSTDRQYTYHYASVGSLYQDMEFSIQSKVGAVCNRIEAWQSIAVWLASDVASVILSVVESSSTQSELSFQFQDTTFSWNPETPQAIQPFGDLSQWFSIIIEANGQLTGVYRLPKETAAVLSFKKTVAKLLGLTEPVEHAMVGSKVVWTQHKKEAGVSGSKKLIFDRNGQLISVEFVESWSHDYSADTPTFMYPMHSNSSLILIEDSEVGVVTIRPSDIILDTIKIEPIINYLPLSEIAPSIASTLDECFTNGEDGCLLSLAALFQKLSSDDIVTYIDGYFASLDNSEVEKTITILNALSHLQHQGNSTLIGDALTRHILLSSIIDDSIAQFYLGLLTRGKILPNEATMDAVLDLIMLNNESPLTRQALLALGGMSRLLRTTNSDLADEIVETLHSLLDQLAGDEFNNGDPSRLRRSISTATYHPLTHATVIDSIGNAHSEHSLHRLLNHVTRSHDFEHESHDLTIRHAAINAIRGLDSEESAAALLTIVDSTPHPSIRHLAATAYQSHSRAKRDLSYITQQSRHSHRSRRQVAETIEHVTNVTMPSVSWSQEFGESNINIDIRRSLRNSFDVAAAPLSSHYTFSLHDQTTFTADLLLNEGPQRTEMLRTDVCLQGTASYNINILTDLDYNLTAYQFEQHSSIVSTLQSSFRDAHTHLTDSENGYSSINDQIQASLDNLPSQFSLVEESLSSYRAVVDAIEGEFILKERVEQLFSSVNQTFVERRGLAMDSIPAISAAVSALLPSLPQALSTSLIVVGLPFTDSTFYVPYLPFAPQQALSNIFTIVQSAESAFSLLRLAALNLLNQTGQFGANADWLGPAPQILHSELGLIVPELEIAIDTAQKCEGQTYDGATLEQLQALSTALQAYLYPAISLLGNVGSELLGSSAQVNSAYQESRESFIELQKVYDQARSQVDAIFGPKFHPQFPRRLRSCEQLCGNYPSTDNSQYNEGIDLILERDLVLPFSSYVRILEPELLPSDLRPLYSAHTGSTLFIPAESSLRNIRLILPNVVPTAGVTMTTGIVQSGARFEGTVSYQSSPYVHVEAFKVLEGRWFRIDPTQFVQPLTDNEVSIQFDCNDVVVHVDGVVVERRQLTSTDIVMEMVGNPLVQGIPDHEFPQPFDLVVRGDDVITSSVEGLNNTDVTLFQTTTTVMVGPIPVIFDFSSIGSYEFSYSPSVNLLSKTLHLPATPTLHAKAQGFMRTGAGTQIAEVAISGTLLQASLPQVLRQDFSVWPQIASTTMDFILVPSTLSLTSQLLRLSGGLADPEILQSNTLWHYSIPVFNRSEFYYEGIFTDITPPEFIPLPYSIDQSSCFVRQLQGQSYDNPAFELEANVIDLDSPLNIFYQVGTSENTGNIIDKTEIGGTRIVVPSTLDSNYKLYFTISAENLNGIESHATCWLPKGTSYARTLPFARVLPIRAVSSHSSKIRALVSLFDRVGFEGVQEVAIGNVPGEDGDGVMAWRPWNASLITTPPPITGGILDQFSFGRTGRLTGDILQTTSPVDNLTSCAMGCYSITQCLSFDYSQQEATCILHSNIEGPALFQNSHTQYPFQNTGMNVTGELENVFQTAPLRTAGSYYHYEKLGTGNSTEFEFSDLVLEDSTMYYINVRIRNKLGVVNVASSNGFLVDLSPPDPGMIRNVASDVVVSDGCNVSKAIPGCLDNSGIPNHRIIVDGPDSATVFNGLSPSLDAMYTSTNNYITAHWQGFQDPQSSLYAYTWCIGTSLGSCDLLPPTDPHIDLGLTTPESWTNTGFASFQNLSDGAYYITVQAISNVDYGGPLATTVHHSTPYIIDTSPPIIDEVFNIQYNHSLNVLSLEYNVTDEQSGIRFVEIAIGRSTRDTALLGWTALQLGGSGTIAVVIPDGIPGWVKLRVTNNAGLRTIAVAENFITVDRTPPLAGTVNDGSEISLDANFQSSLDTLCVNWDGFSDPESGIAKIEWTVSITSSFGSGLAIRSLTPSEIASHMACMPGLSLSHNTTYYSLLSVSNGAMATLTTTGGSDGVRTDSTPPSTGVVSDGPDSSIDLQFSSSQTTVSITWTGVQDYESGIERYLIRIFQQSSEVHTESISGSLSGITWNFFSFSNGDYITAEVQAFNGAGLSSTQVSNGFTIDLTPPELLYIVDGNTPSVDELFQSSINSIQVAWNATDRESGIFTVEGVIFEAGSSRRQQVYPVDGSTELISSNNVWSISGLQLISGQHYVVSLAITNGAGSRSVYESSGVTVDSTPPVIESVSIMSDTYTNTDTLTTADKITDRINIRWSGLDRESGISQYLVGVVNENFSSVTPNTTFDGSARGGLIENIALTPGEDLYYLAVFAVNNVGLMSAPFYSSQFRIVDGDSAGVVVDGDSPDQADIDYTNELTTITAQFYGFNSQTCGGISVYEWAVGVADDQGGVAKERVMLFTTQGVVTLDSSSGYAQIPIPNLSSYAGVRLYITVRGMTDCGDILESTSDGFVVLTQPPSLRIHSRRADPTDLTEGDIYQNFDMFSVSWEVSSDSNERTFVKLGSYPNGDNVQVEKEIAESYFRSVISSMEGVPLYVTVMAVNSAELETVAISQAVVMDTSPPTAEVLSSFFKYYPSSPQHLILDSTLPNTGVLNLQLSSLSDPESGLADVAISIGTTPNDQSLLSRTTLIIEANTTTVQSPFLTIDPSIEELYATLYVMNYAGIESVVRLPPLACRPRPPVFQGDVLVEPNSNSADYGAWTLPNSSPAVCLQDTDIVTVSFIPTEAANCVRYEIGIGKQQTNDDIRTFEAISPVASNTNTIIFDTIQLANTDFSPADSSPVYFNVRCFSNNGLYSTVSSRSIFIKTDSSSSWISDGDADQDVDCQTSTTEISGRVFVDVNCPIRFARWSVINDGDVLAEYSINNTRYLSNNTFDLFTDEVILYTDQSYRIHFFAEDYCGQVHRLNSDGVYVIHQSISPCQVADGNILDYDLNFQMSISSLSAQWPICGDPEGVDCQQQPARYLVAWGSDPRFSSTRTDIVPFTDVGLNTSVTFDDLQLSPMATYYCTVRVIAVSGDFADATSNGVTVGFEQGIQPGELIIDRYQYETSSISLYWSDFQSNLPIRQYEVALGTTQLSDNALELSCQDTSSDFAGEFNVFGFTSVNLDTLASFGGLNLTHNTTYYVALRVLDQADHCLTVTTESGITIDTSPPETGDSPDFVRVGTDASRMLNVPPTIVVYIENNEIIRVSWSPFGDAESGVVSYEVALYRQAVCGDTNSSESVTEFKSAGVELDTEFMGVSFEVGVVYVAVVQGMNGAGLNSIAYSLPFVVDSLEYFTGDVKDGSSWESDVTFQSSLSMLSATLTHTKLPPATPHLAITGPCPNSIFYTLSNFDNDWSALEISSPISLFTTGLVLAASQVNASINGIPGIAITAVRDPSAAATSRLLTGGYTTRVSLSRGGVISLDILAASGDYEFEINAITSVLLIDGSPPNTFAAFVQDNGARVIPESLNYNMLGLQIYRGNTSDQPQMIELWAQSGDPDSTLVYISHDLAHVDLSLVHTFAFDFKSEETDYGQSHYVSLFIDGVLEARLHGIPMFSNNTQMVLHVFGRTGYVPQPFGFENPAVQAVFGNVSLPMMMGGLCDYGQPFFSQGGPIVEFRAGVGSVPGADDIVTFETVSTPCLTCLPTTPCPAFGCDPNCTLQDPYSIPLLFTNLSLSPGIHNNLSNSSIDPSVRETLSSVLIGQFQPATYFVTVKAITASGRSFQGISDGVTIDTTPPILVSEIEQFDVLFSLNQPSRFQSNNNSIAARWLFEDTLSGITEYLWAIGTQPYGENIKPLTSVGMATRATNSNLQLQQNITYYVMVSAVNGAGLSTNATSFGITYIESELNASVLEGFVTVESTDVLRVVSDDGELLDIAEFAEPDRVGVSWSGIGEDVEEIFWSISSDRDVSPDDVFPRTFVSFNNSQSATINAGTLYLNNQPFASVAELIALAEGRVVSSSDSQFYFEPGRLLYHHLEFCNFVHLCTTVTTGPSVLIRENDIKASPRLSGDRVSVTVIQELPPGTNQALLSTQDREYVYTLSTTGVTPDSILITGYLSHADVTQNYRVSMAYISNPFQTMAQTSREIARRFTEIGGPSFYISFLGQDSLSSVVEVNVTFDGSLDWAAAIPELAYWDIDDQVWREVSATCLTSSLVDWPSLTISVEICSTLLNDLASRSAGLSRRRRQVSSGMGSGMTPEPLSYLDRPTQFIVIRVGNTSTNTAPVLSLPTDPITVTEDNVLQYQLAYSDAEDDSVSFHLSSLPKLGSANLSSNGTLTYTPCYNCIGLDILNVYITEIPAVDTQIPLTARGQLLIRIENINDSPELYLYTNLTSEELAVSRSVNVFIDANRTSAVRVASIAGFDFDGYNDDLSISVQSGSSGLAGSEIWLDAVNVPESLPISFLDGTNSVLTYSDYVTFIGAYITYQPNDPNFIGPDTVNVRVRDSNSIFSTQITIVIEVLPSLCQNNGVCGGSELDPDCSDIVRRRSEFQGYNCSCPIGFGGQYCEFQTSTPSPEPQRVCPVGVPLVECEGDPCREAVCPSHEIDGAICSVNKCGDCTVEWHLPNGTQVTCHDERPGICNMPDFITGFPTDCASVTCDCPANQFQCPEDSVFTRTRVDECCVSYECVCPNISCPYLMEGGTGLQPVPQYRGNMFPGRCCPSYDYLDINECLDNSQHMCTDICTNQDMTYSCSCPPGKTLAKNGITCGVCPYNGMEYLIGDRVMIGCNWCICRGDNLSGERWHCTAAPCEQGCFANGQFYPVSSVRTQGLYNCSCEATDTSAEWICTTSN